jgi:hypothetical protein
MDFYHAPRLDRKFVVGTNAAVGATSNEKDIVASFMMLWEIICKSETV